jgi:hypothetical protein
MDALVWFSWLGQAGEQGRRRAIVCAAYLTSMACLKMGSNVSIHTRPVETLEEALFCFVDAIVTYKEVAMGIR